MNIFDAIWIVIVAIGFILGFKKGFFDTITKPVKIIGSICLTVLVATPVLNVWTRPFFTDKIGDWMTSSLNDAGAVATDELPGLLKFAIELLQVDVESVNTIEDLVSVVSAPVGNFVAVIVTYVALFIVLMLLLTLLISILGVAFHKGLLGKLNKVLGMLLGGVIAVVVACILVNIVGGFAPNLVGGAISQFFKNFNPFSLMLKF